MPSAQPSLGPSLPAGLKQDRGVAGLEGPGVGEVPTDTLIKGVLSSEDTAKEAELGPGSLNPEA